MKALIGLMLLMSSLSSYACNDVEADALVLDRTKMMAKRYNAKKIGIGHSILWGDTRFTSISIMDGDGGNTGDRLDRIGTILINMDTCVVKGKLIGIYDTINID